MKDCISRSLRTTSASVGVFTLPTGSTSLCPARRAASVYARERFMPMSQSARDLASADSFRWTKSRLSRRSSFALRILFSSRAFNNILFTGFLLPTKSNTSSTRSCPSRSGSPAFTISSALAISIFTVLNCFAAPSSTKSFHWCGMIGRSSARHCLYLGSYSAGSA